MTESFGQMMMNVLTSPQNHDLLVSIGLGTVCGWCAKQAIRSTIFIMGVGFLGYKYAQNKGFVIENLDFMNYQISDVNKASNTIINEFGIKTVSQGGFGGGFLVGLYLG